MTMQYTKVINELAGMIALRREGNLLNGANSGGVSVEAFAQTVALVYDKDVEEVECELEDAVTARMKWAWHVCVGKLDIYAGVEYPLPEKRL